MKYPIDWDSDVQIRRLFSYQTRIGLAPKFGTMPIAYYQQDQVKTYDKIMKELNTLESLGYIKLPVEVKKTGSRLSAKVNVASEFDIKYGDLIDVGLISYLMG